MCLWGSTKFFWKKPSQTKFFFFCSFNSSSQAAMWLCYHLYILTNLPTRYFTLCTPKCEKRLFCKVSNENVKNAVTGCAGTERAKM